MADTSAQKRWDQLIWAFQQRRHGILEAQGVHCTDMDKEAGLLLADFLKKNQVIICS